MNRAQFQKHIARDPLLAAINWPLMLTAAQLVASSDMKHKTLLDVADTYERLRTRQKMRAEQETYDQLASGDWRDP